MDDELHVSAIDEYGQTVDQFVINKYAALEVEQAPLPTEFRIDPNYPNPFADSTTIRYHIVEPTVVSLELYNVLGQKIATLVQRHHTPGSYTVRFDAARLASGTYTYRLQAGFESESRQFTVAR